MAPSIITHYSICKSKNVLFNHMRELIKSRGKAELYVVNAHILCEGNQGYRVSLNYRRCNHLIFVMESM